MKKFIISSMIAVSALSLAACGQRVKFNEAAVEVIEAGSNAGVQEREVATGRYWKAPWSLRYIVKFPITQQTFTWAGRSGFDYINADRVPTTQAVSANIRINPSDADNLVRKYQGAITKNGGEDGYVLDDIVNGPVTRELAQAFIQSGVKYTSAQLYADGGAALLQDVKARVAPKFAKDGIIIEDLLIVGKPGFPADIVASITAAQKAVEDARRKEAELAATIAEGKKTIAKADAEAQSRALTAASIRANPEVLKFEEIKRRGASWCPVGVTTCILGNSVLASGN
jgi:regulator of protease activity HflC (stomatin/prohibitin superfamily)